jgi:predicted TPR repeat methyltransferase
MQRSGEVAAAEQVYDAVLALEPGNPTALHFLGLLRFQQRRPDEALALVERAVALDPDYVDAINNLGNLLKLRRRPEEAEQAYRRVLAQRPEHPQALTNLGILLRRRRAWEESEACFRAAMAADETHAGARYNYGNLLVDLGRAEEAVAAYRQALALFPQHYEALKALGTELYRLGRVGLATEVYERLLAIDPENPVAVHMLAACSGENTPERAPDGYVRRVFDAMASTFDEHLAELAYRAPALVADALAEALGEPAGTLAVLDAGCGTGLCGPWLRPYAAALTGVDLSPAMLAQARERAEYDHLVETELTAYLERSRHTFDVIVSADTLVYFGRLERVLAAAFEALRDGGFLAYTVERLREPEQASDFGLGPSGRYAHAPHYVHAVLEGAGFIGVQIEPVQLRLERGVPVDGLLVSARRPVPLPQRRRPL